MRTGKPFRSARVTAAAAFALCAALTSAVVPAPAHAADTVRSLQWYLDSLKIPQAHKTTQGKGVVVAIIDGGVDANHPDLKGQVLAGHGVNAASAPDGRRDDDLEKGHGTSMAGVVAGRGGGAQRELGIAPAAKILPVSMGARFNGDDLVLAIRWAADNGADVINLSLGSEDGGPAAPGLVDAIQYAFSKDAVVVASAGNVEQGDRQVIPPANIPGVIAVSGLSKRGSFFTGSAQGPETVLAAPMENIIAPSPKAVSPNGYTVSSGTSRSAAIVSGVVALVRAKYPQLDAANVVNRLIKTARDAGPNGRDPQYGFGVIDPLAALSRSVPAVTANPLLEGAAASPTRPGAARPGDDDGPAVEFGVTNKAGAIVQVGLCLAVPIIALIILLVVLRRRKRRAAVAGPTGTPPPGWPAAPAGWPTPAGPVPPGQSVSGYGPPPGQPVPGYGPPPGQPVPGYGPPPGQPAPGYPPPGQPTPGYPPPGYPPSAGQPTPGYPPAQPAPPPAGSAWPGGGTGQIPPPPGPQQQ
ncbi:S8 family serine peptidase [Micromonospora sp. CPCC 205539]|uniref:S8 family serine peptidase n=1 Tax=Micromonospora sp. CPCC 205539 TaxID=3122408 RepID=UPI002FF0F802